MSDDAARHEAELEEQARRRTQEISAGEAAAQRAAAAVDEDRSPDAEIAEVQRSGRQHDYTDTAAYHQQPAPADRRRRGGPRR